MMKILHFILFFILFLYNLNAQELFTPEEKAFIQKKQLIQVAGEMDWPPYDFVENGQHQGIIRDYLDLISKQTGLKFNIKTGYTWTELLNMAKNKQIDLMPVLIKIPKRESYLTFTKEYIKSREYAYTLDSEQNIERMEDLFGKVVAIPQSYASIDIIKKHYPKIRILETKSPLDALDKLITRKADAIIQNHALTSYLIKDQNITTIKAAFNVSILNKSLRMGVRKDRPLLSSIIQKALDDLSNEQKEQILSKWLFSNKHLEEKITLSQSQKRFIRQNPVIKVANQFSEEPYNFYTDKEAKGYLVDYMNLLGKQVGLHFEFVSNPWHILKKDILNKRIDVLPAAQKGNGLDKALFLTPSHFKINHSIVVRNTQHDIKNLKDLNGKTVALRTDDTFAKTLQKAYPTIKVKLFSSNEEIIDAVAFKEVDASIVDVAIANYFINKKLFSNITIAGKAQLKNFDNNLYLGIRSDWPILEQLMQKAVEEISPASLSRLNKKWINKDSSADDILSKREKNYLQDKIFNITATNNWAPFNFISPPQVKPYGITIDYWNLIAQKANIQYKATLQDNFPQVLQSLKNKSQDILFGTAQTSSKEDIGLFTSTYQSFPISIATRDNENFMPNARSLIGKRVAVGKGFTAYEILKKYYPNINFIFTKNTPEALKLLSARRVDAVVDIVPTLIYYINNLGLSDLKISGHTGYNLDLKIMVRKEHAPLVPILNKLIQTITPLEKQHIYDKWIRINYKKDFDYTLFWQIIFVFVIIVGVIVYRHRQLIKYQKIIQAKNTTLEKQKEALEESHKIIQQTQKNVENSLHSFTTLVDSTLEALLIVATGRIIYVNDEAVNLFKDSSKESLTSKKILELFHPDCKEQVLEISVTCSIQGHELIAQKANNENFPVLIKTKDIKFQNMDAKIISIVDLTELKNKEKMLQEQSKMASMGEMIGNIAHQWRQPLSIISTSASGLKMSKDFGKLNDAMFDRSIHNILNNTEFLSQTIDDFKNFILQNKELVQFDLENLVNKTLLLIEASLKENNIEHLTDVQKDVSLFNYENELNQALINIINNSKDALKDNPVGERFLFVKAYKENENAVIKIRDNGGGIDEAIIDQIFEPYTTTKHKALGAGLGLYMTHKLIQESIQGSIYAENISFVYKDRNYTGVEVCVNIPLFKKTVRKETDQLIKD